MKELLKVATSQFEKNKIPAVDAEILLAHLLGISRKQIHAQYLELADEDREKLASNYTDLINQRLVGRPVQYITGSAPFRYLDLEVGEGVLIPRPETELIVDRVIGFLNSSPDKNLQKSVIDLGAGSGAISIAIATEAALKGFKLSVVAVEKSAEAAIWLNKNIAKYDLPIRVVIEDVVTALPDVKADLVVANPPYIPNDEKLPIEVASYEPEIALRGGPVDGMQIPKQFIDSAARLLKSGGFFVMEHHEMQSNLVKNAMAESFSSIQTHSDLTGRDRFTSARRK